MKPAIVETKPLSSMSLPNKAPRRNSGKNWAMKPAALPMKVWVQWASRGSPAKEAAMRAATGARRRTLQPRKASQMRSRRPSRIPIRPMASYALEQLVEIERRAFSQIVGVSLEERLGRGAAAVPQHGQERPLGVELGGIAELDHLVVADAVDAHAGPHRTFA